MIAPALKAAYTTRNVPLDAIADLERGASVVPRSGDLVLARVRQIGQHKRLELRDGRRATLFDGDEILVAFGNRYASDQFEAIVPGRLEPCDLVAAGGVAARTVARHGNVGVPTAIRPVGLALDARGQRLNLRRFPTPRPPRLTRPPLVVGVLGASMNVGKTTTAAHLVRGLRAAGLRTGAAKLTGTGAGGDRWLFEDAGADAVLDFTDAGVVSTSLLEPARVNELCRELVGRLGGLGMEAGVVEVADGLLQPETSALVAGDCFRAHVDVVVFAAGDAMSAVAGARWLRDAGWEPDAVSGLVSSSPLASREAEAACGLPVLDRAGLEDPDRAMKLVTEVAPAAALSAATAARPAP